MIDRRTGLGIHQLTSGLTGWAQVNGRDRVTVKEKVRFDAEYLHQQSFWFYLRILAVTIGKVFVRDGISH